MIERTGFGTLGRHLGHVREALEDLERHAALIERWGGELAALFRSGGKLLTAGNGGSAAEAQHLTAELVGRFEMERRPLSAIALTAETSSLTAIANDFSADDMFARQVHAHARPGDVLLLLTTSGRSPNLLRAAERGREQQLQVWAMTGARPNPLADLADQVLAIGSPSSTAVQEAQLIAVHALCAALERRLATDLPAGAPLATLPRAVSG